MSDHDSLPHALPDGLRICETCDEACGTTVNGSVSACYCSGIICNRCGKRERRPISDYYQWRTGAWLHVAWFGPMGHTCPPEADPSKPRGWTALERDPDVRAFQRASTAIAMAELQGVVEPAPAYSIRVKNGEAVGYALGPSGPQPVVRLRGGGDESAATDEDDL